MSLQVLHPQLNQWVPPHLAQQHQQMAYYYAYDQQIEAQKTIQHWSNISPRDSDSDDSDGSSSCHSSVSNQSPRSEYGIFEISLPEERRVTFEQVSSPALSEDSDKKAPTCLGILDEMEELSLSEPTLPKVNIPATTMAFVQQTNMSSGLSMSAPPTPRDGSTASQQRWMTMAPRSSSANNTPTNFGATTPTDYASVSAIAPAGGNSGVFPPTSVDPQQQQQVRAEDGHKNSHHHQRHSRHRHRSRQQSSQRQQHRRSGSKSDYYGSGSSMMYYPEQMQHVQYPYGYSQQQQYAQYQMQQQAAAYHQMAASYGYPQQSYYGANGVPVVQANGYNCM